MEKRPQSVIRNVVILMIAIAVVVATHVVKFSAAAEEGAPENKYIKVLDGENFRTDIENVEDGVDEVMQTYHKTVNDIFNNRIAAMVALGNGQNPADLDKMLALVTPPPIIFDQDGLPLKREDTCEGEDTIQNLSTYCLAIPVVNEYFEFREAMIKARAVVKEQAGTAARKLTRTELEALPDTLAQQQTIFGAITGEEKIQEYGEVINRIDREIDIARQSLDQSLAAYSELQMALPLHQKYLQVIKALETYRDKVSSIRREIDLYPVTFLDVTTPQCT